MPISGAQIGTTIDVLWERHSWVWGEMTLSDIKDFLFKLASSSMSSPHIGQRRNSAGDTVFTIVYTSHADRIDHAWFNRMAGVGWTVVAIEPGSTVLRVRLETILSSD
jgi:hypothetical protein